MSHPALSLFHPLVEQWFGARVGTPTEVQARAWPRIAGGGHLLVTAPTGSGKTLTAFLWALDRLAGGHWPAGQTSVLYVSPLKALNNDIRRNLLAPLEELRQAFAEAGEPFPDLRVMTRSGDTPASERRQMLRRPPEILITTPESLNLLLSSAGGRSILTGLRTVILDEIHAVVGSKRGVHLITAVERLVPLCGEFQRLALSATVRPLEAVAAFVGGQEASGPAAAPRLRPRQVEILRSSAVKQYDVRVRFPEAAADPDDRDSVWEPLVAEFHRIIAANRSTLLFTNSRRLAEKLTLFINDGQERPLAYAHHGSLSREVREEVEARLKAGDLKAIVATNSLEMGIDIGALDEVVLVQAPPAISAGIQRVGRAGHRVGEVSRAALFPTHSHDFLEAAALAAGIQAQDIEAVRPVEGPLDVLAQVLISMVGVETWDLDALYTQVRTSYPYRNLSRGQFDLVLNMLAGRYADTRIRELRPRLSIDRLSNTAEARKGALQDLYLSGGTIPDRGYFHLRLQDGDARLGELDEEFVWESAVGQTFTLGAQSWTIQRITHNDVFVTPAAPRAMNLPFWIGEPANRDAHFSSRIAELLEEADARLGDDAWATDLRRRCCLDEVAAEQLLDYLRRQREATGCALPHRHHLVLEQVESGPGGLPGNQVILHTFWGGRVNRPFALALDAAWERRFDQRLEIYPGNDCIAIVLPHEDAGEVLLSLVTAANFESLLRQRLEGSGFFGARFRESAGRALLLARSHHNQRIPLWITRLRSQKLFDAVTRYEDFPILVEAWRTCLQDEFDLPALQRTLAELETGALAWSAVRTAHPSPFARSITWRQINQYMYMGDESAGAGGASRLRSDLLREVVFDPQLRPGVPAEVVAEFEQKRQRLWPGYAPQTWRELVDWVAERVALPADEWPGLLQAVERDGQVASADLLAEAGPRLVEVRGPGLAAPLVAASERLPWLVATLLPGVAADLEIASLADGAPVRVPALAGPGEVDAEAGDEADGDPLAALLSEWLPYYGPQAATRVAAVLGLDGERLQRALDDLLDGEALVAGQLLAGGGEELVCDSQNLEALLRLARARSVPAFEPLGLEQLPLFLAHYHGLCELEPDDGALERRFEQLLCWEAPAALWESDLLPARLPGYASARVDGLLQESLLRWVGCGRGRVTFCFEPDLDLRRGLGEGEGQIPPGGADPGVAELFPDPEGRYDFAALLRLNPLGAAELARRLWEGVWRGQVTNDALAALRRGIETGFAVAELPGAPPPGDRAGDPAASRRPPRLSRAAASRWRGSQPYPGSWRLLPEPAPSEDALEADERGRDRVRLLLDRYGVLCRELLQREAPAFRWAAVFRSLRLMELAGEVVAGQFFRGIPGPQFASHRAFRLLQRRLPERALYWLSAADPVSLCGVALDGLRGNLPRRVPTTHLACRGAEVVVISQRTGRELTVRLEPGDPDLVASLGVLRHLQTRPLEPVRQLVVETINGEPAAR
ncbi:MAG: DEAD/DEAH box helicase, partial [Gemmatimonadota bacterium]